jgi:hypothetical protein
MRKCSGRPGIESQLLQSDSIARNAAKEWYTVMITQALYDQVALKSVILSFALSNGFSLPDQDRSRFVSSRGRRVSPR